MSNTAIFTGYAALALAFGIGAGKAAAAIKAKEPIPTSAVIYIAVSIVLCSTLLIKQVGLLPFLATGP